MKQIKNGVYPTMITPYTKDNRIDYDAVSALMDYYKEAGAAGIFAICQSSEIFFLSFEERLELLKYIMSHKPEGLDIIASGHVSDDPDVTVKEAQAFIATGIDAYVFISNRFARQDEDDDVLLSRMNAALDKLPTDIGYGVYECPYPYKRVLTPYVMKKMAETGRFEFLKDTCCDLDLIRGKLDAVKGSGLRIFNANGATLLKSLRMGCSGYSGVMANFHTELYSQLCEIYRTEPEKAELIQDFIGFFSVAECQCYPVNAKYYRSLCGMKINTDSRARDKADLTSSRMLEIQQMKKLTDRFESYLKTV